MAKKKEGNSEQVVEEVMNTMVEDSNADFFDALETQVNGAIQDTPAEQVKESVPGQETPAMDSSSREVPQNTNWEDESNPYKVRYSDSTREAQRLKAEDDAKADKLKKLEPYESLISVLEQDAELVNIVRGYLDKGSNPSMKESLNLGDDFVFDMDEAISDPNSQSARVLNSMVDRRAEQKSKDIISAERQKAQQAAQKRNLHQQAKEFVDTSGMSKDEFTDLSKWAQSHRLSWDDLWYLKNRDKANAKIANNSKQQVIDQMKNVQSMPATATSAGGENPGDRDHNDSIFDLIQKADNNLENIFNE
tara:strand:- start:624 stop:1541 length:918 start_codon:yes stop_codon:yes gene_type:complete